MRHIPAGPPPESVKGVYERVIDEAGWDNEHCGAWIVQLCAVGMHSYLVFHYSDHEALDTALAALHDEAPGAFTDIADVEFTEDENHEPIDQYQVTDTDWFFPSDEMAMQEYHSWPTDLARYEFITLHCIREGGSWSVNDATQRGYVVMPKEPTLKDMVKALIEKEAINYWTRNRFVVQPDTAEGTHTLQDGRKTFHSFGKYEYEFRRVK